MNTTSKLNPIQFNQIIYLMHRIRLIQMLCSLFPPIISQRLRNYLYPWKINNNNFSYSKRAITGSIFKSTIDDYHGYRFLFHGFFDWRNIIIANSLFEINKGDIIEIGANIGTETISLCDIARGKGIVHAFEPYLPNYNHLVELLKTQNNLKLYHLAISDKNGVVSFEEPPESQSGVGKIITESQNSQNELLRIKTKKLDYFIEDFKNIQLITIDTEGHEPHVLQGSEKIIEHYSPLVIIEVSPQLLSKYSNSSPRDIKTFFLDKGYKVFKISRFSIRDIEESDLRTHKSVNWICVHNKNSDIFKKIKRDLLYRTLIPWYLLPALKKV